MEPDQPADGTAVRRLYEPYTHYPVARALSEKTPLLDAVEQLFGPDLLFQYSKLNMIPAAAVCTDDDRRQLPRFFDERGLLLRVLHGHPW